MEKQQAWSVNQVCAERPGVAGEQEVGREQGVGAGLSHDIIHL